MFVQDEELSDYFSIPYILTSDWEETDRFKHLFEKEWIDSLMENIQFELEDMSKS